VLGHIAPGELLDAAALRRMFGLSRDLMIRSAALMGAYAWFAAQGSRMGEVALSANAVLLNLLMIVAYFLDGIAQAAEQLTGKAVGANWRPAFDQAYGLSMVWGLILTLTLGAAWYLGGPWVIGLMTTNEEVQAYALTYLPIAALCTVTFMPAFVYDGILVGTTLNTTMRNGMVVSLVVFLGAAWRWSPCWAIGACGRRCTAGSWRAAASIGGRWSGGRRGCSRRRPDHPDAGSTGPIYA
jgi:Na+-driven multidrug efflux pump